MKTKNILKFKLYSCFCFLICCHWPPASITVTVAWRQLYATFCSTNQTDSQPLIILKGKNKKTILIMKQRTVCVENESLVMI